MCYRTFNEIIMWKEELPKNCPPETAEEVEDKVYRIIKETEPTEGDFFPYIKLYPRNSRYKNLCKAYAVSFFDTIENAKKAFVSAQSRNRYLGEYIAEYNMSKDLGRCEYKKESGHYSIWFYSSWNFNNFEPATIIPVNEN